MTLSSLEYKNFWKVLNAKDYGIPQNREHKNGIDGKPEILEKEAEIVREIYRKLMKGKTTSLIANYLTENNIKTPARKDKWQKSTVDSILTNEKYKGDALL